MKNNKKNLLVFERIDHLEYELSAYIKQNFPDHEIEIIYHADSAKQEDIIAAIKKCDVIAFQSIFETKLENGTQTFEKMIRLFHAKPELRKPVHIIHSKDELIYTLNINISMEGRKMLEEMLMCGLEVTNVHFKIFEEKTEERSYFRKLVYVFAPVRIWYNKKHNWIWDEHEHFLPNYHMEIDLFKKKTVFVNNSEALEQFLSLSKTDLLTLRDVLEECGSRITELKDDLENDRGFQFDIDEKKDLIKSHDRKLKLLDKFNIFIR